MSLESAIVAALNERRRLPIPVLQGILEREGFAVRGTHCIETPDGFVVASNCSQGFARALENVVTMKRVLFVITARPSVKPRPGVIVHATGELRATDYGKRTDAHLRVARGPDTRHRLDHGVIRA